MLPVHETNRRMSDKAGKMVVVSLRKNLGRIEMYVSACEGMIEHERMKEGNKKIGIYK